ncbi:hypothetical protein [Rugamonas sp.]|uniref:hypothetical protein n=1 Tax=Rugamonas sp. TaxID=1926287 RepID=UPI0025D8C73F|nr:hypothetical protein [Rugamonas sp.]
MVSPSPSPKKTTIAAVSGAVFAGLLLAALGTYVACATPEAAPAAGIAGSAVTRAAASGPASPAAQSAPSAPNATATATAGSAAGTPAPAHQQHTKAEAAAALMALPELQAWSAQIEKHSGGATHGALIEDDPAPRVVKGKRYWQFSFVENTPDAALRWESFLIAADGDILIDDVASDELLTLERWRKEKQPARRTGADGG